jgi:hypothetical protein
VSNQHPIIPPPELKELWINDGPPLDQPKFVAHYVADQAAQWGWDQRGAATEAELQEARDEELEACCEWLQDPDLNVDTYKLRAARRPSPPSLKEQALELLPEIESEDVLHLCPLQVAKIRRALETIND